MGSGRGKGRGDGGELAVRAAIFCICLCISGIVFIVQAAVGSNKVDDASGGVAPSPTPASWASNTSTVTTTPAPTVSYFSKRPDPLSTCFAGCMRMEPDGPQRNLHDGVRWQLRDVRWNVLGQRRLLGREMGPSAVSRRITVQLKRHV